jgi:hypothetical protein
LGTDADTSLSISPTLLLRQQTFSSLSAGYRQAESSQSRGRDLAEVDKLQRLHNDTGTVTHLEIPLCSEGISIEQNVHGTDVLFLKVLAPLLPDRVGLLDKNDNIL